MTKPERVYLDNAATSWPKPEAVYQAVEQYQRHVGVAAGRGAYHAALDVEAAVASARQAVAELLGITQPWQVIWTSNGTDALNLVLHGFLRPGDHVVTSAAEHNSVLRPLRFLSERSGIEVSYAACDPQGRVDLEELAAARRPHTRLIALVHASNVTGGLQPVAEAARLAHECGARFLLDAAQTLGHLPFRAEETGADFLAAAGHKGPLGPLGTGLLYLRPGLEAEVDSVRQGGTGTVSDQDAQPSSLPDKFEAGNLNVPGLLGLAAGVRYLLQQGLPALHLRAQTLTARLVNGLRALPHVTVYGPPDPAERLGVVSFNIGQADPREVAAILDASYHIQARAGLHCAPRMHHTLGTLTRGGTVRFSLGPFTTEAEIDRALAAVRDISEAS